MNEPVGEALYHDGNVITIFECAKKAGTYASQGKALDVHCVDAAGEALSHLHVALRGHEDEPQPVGAADVAPEIAGEHVLAICDQYAAMPVMAADAGAIDPTLIALLLQLVPYLWKLIGR